MSAPNPATAPGDGGLRDVGLVLLGLLVGAIAGLVIAGYAGWLPSFNFC